MKVGGEITRINPLKSKEEEMLQDLESRIMELLNEAQSALKSDGKGQQEYHKDNFEEFDDTFGEFLQASKALMSLVLKGTLHFCLSLIGGFLFMTMTLITITVIFANVFMALTFYSGLKTTLIFQYAFGRLSTRKRNFMIRLH